MIVNQLQWCFKLAAIGSLLCLANSHRADAASFQGLGSLAGDDFKSFPTAVSSDGSTVVGYSNSELGRQAFRWSRDTGMVGLGDFSGGNFFSQAEDVSGDGSVVVGTGENQLGRQAFRWSQDTGMTELGYLEDSTESYGTAVSEDGQTIIGYSEVAATPAEIEYYENLYIYPYYYSEPFHWTQANGISSLGLPEPYRNFIPVAASSDTSVIVGTVVKEDKYFFDIYLSGQYILTADGFEVLPDFTTFASYGIASSYVGAISGDGSVLVGELYSWLDYYSSDALFWQDTKITYLETSDTLNTTAYGVADDGSVIVGEIYDYDFNNNTIVRDAFIWDSQTGIVPLQDILTTQYNLDLTGWRLTSAIDISGDKQTIVGRGINPDGNSEAWIVNLADTNDSFNPDGNDTTTPEPSNAAAFFLFGCLAVSKIRQLI